MCNYKSVATKTDFDSKKINFEFSARFLKYFLALNATKILPSLASVYIVDTVLASFLCSFTCS